MIDDAKLLNPDIRLFGQVNTDMLASFFEQYAEVTPDSGALVIELTTQGGDADIGRRLAQQIRLIRKRGRRDCVFVGATTVYSAGVTIMAAVPRSHRYLTSDAALLIHERQATDFKPSNGPLSAALQIAKSKVAELETGVKLEWQGFSELIEGSKVTEDELRRRAATNWYLTAEEALERGLIAAVI